MWTDQLRKNNVNDDRLIIVEVNAWNDDYCGDPFFSLVSALIESLQQEDPAARKLFNAAKDIGWFLTGIGSQVVNKLTGIDPVSAGELAEKKKSTRGKSQRVPDNYFDVFRAKKKALHVLKNSIKNLISGEDPSILILVDELDRCRPDYAISYLETINHIFDIHGIVFVLAVDRNQLECSAKAAFGTNLDFPEYFRKFVHREVILPKPKAEEYRRLASKYVNYYLEIENERFCYMELTRTRIDNLIELISAMQMTLRQIQEVFRIMGHVLETDELNKGRLRWCLGTGTILMSVLRTGKPDIYEALGKQNLGPKKASSFFRELGLSAPDWWFTLCYTGGGLNSEEMEGKEFADILKDVGFISGEKNAGSRHGDLGQWSAGWGYSSGKRFKELYARIEEISSWN